MEQKIAITLPDGTRTEALAPVIVSASRSTDIPAFFAGWFMNRLRAGYSVWVNPFNQRPSYVSFRNTRVIVFWSKNPAPLLPYLDELDAMGFSYYFQFTLNNYEPEKLEPRVPPLEKRIETFRKLSERLGPDRVIWRADPIILTPALTPEVILTRISSLSARLRGLTRKLVFSFIDVNAYQKVQRNLVKEKILAPGDLPSAEATSQEQGIIAAGLRDLRDYWSRHGWDFALATCAEGADLTCYGVEHNRCIDPDLMARAFPDDILLQNHLAKFRIGQGETDLFNDNSGAFDYRKFKDRGQRQVCGCVASKDIGMYNTCPHGCVYCYANASRNMAEKNFQACLRNPGSESLLPFAAKH
ncbi:DUF1848 domain-containing protein [Succinimonas amylolytica]|uniref:DUF1848 domain-containing protein n=2 Tax=Succinimonas amylolytica TaxID=83769 RepID=UPI00036152A2|nr:DUF1848 domain-containing protein [Succinimonas amylolytica]